jgi:D-alanine--D-alanine ligase
VPGPVDDALGWPRFVKPANMGSSVGVTKVASAGELAGAMEQAFLYDEWVVVEEGVTAREVECAVLGGLHPEATMLGEIVPKAEFYDYDDKYSGEGADLFVPADVPEEVHDEGRRLAVRAFEALRCDGLARVDFFYEEGGRGLIVNEVNTMPGFTPYSMYPRLWAASGVSYAELIDRLVTLARERHTRRASRRGRAR